MPQVCACCQQTTSEPVIVAIKHSASVGGHTLYAFTRQMRRQLPQTARPVPRHPTVYTRHTR